MSASKQTGIFSIRRNRGGFRQRRLWRATSLAVVVFLLVLGMYSLVGAEETADELYEQGRFQEALDAYDRLDLENPRDLRYRYNRGCAAYRTGDYQRALAAFSSLRRRLDTLGERQAGRELELRAKATFNMGNSAFQQGAYEMAVGYYKQALEYEQTRADARHNLELALRRLAENEKEKEGGGEDPAGGPPENEKEDGGQTDPGGDGSGESSPEEAPKTEQDEERGEDDEGPDASGKEGNETDGKTDNPTAPEKREEELDSQDLSGDLMGPQVGDTPLSEEDDGDTRNGVSIMDRERAEALLDNVIEDRARFLRFQVPEDKADGVPSGKDW